MADTPSPPADLSQIDFWLFDLDNTLYSPAAGLFRQVDERMGRYIMELEGVDAVTARQIQKGYFHDHGTTLAGLMAHHGVTPAHFLDYVHDVDLSVLRPNQPLHDAIAALPSPAVRPNRGMAVNHTALPSASRWNMLWAM